MRSFLNRTANEGDNSSSRRPTTSVAGQTVSVVGGHPTNIEYYEHNGSLYMFSLGARGNFDVGVISLGNATNPINMQILRYRFNEGGGRHPIGGIQGYLLGRGVLIQLDGGNAITIDDSVTVNPVGNGIQRLPRIRYDLATEAGRRVFFSRVFAPTFLTADGRPKAETELTNWSHGSITVLNVTDPRALLATPPGGVTALRLNTDFQPYPAP
jgi:hypothetical protein